jgi:hypothetical protein
MNKIDLEFTENVWILLFLIGLSIVFSIYSYKKTNPKPTETLKIILISLRAFVYFIGILLLGIPLFKSYKNINHTSEIILLIDKSKSMEGFNNQISNKTDSLKKTFKDQKISTIEFNPSKNFTDINESLSKMNNLEINDKVFLLTDGNQTEETAHSKKNDFDLTIIPIGNYKKNVDIDIDYTGKKSFQFKRTENLSFDIKTNTRGSFLLFVNDSLISRTVVNQSLSVKNDLKINKLGSYHLTAIYKTTKNEIKKNYIITSKDNRLNILHLFQKPNLEAKFFSLQLNESLIKRYHFSKYNWDTKFDILLLSDIPNDKNIISKIEEFTKKSTSPIVLFQNDPIKINLKGINSLRFYGKNSKKLQLSKNLPNDFKSFFTLTNSQLVDTFPKTESNKVTFELKAKRNIESLFNDQIYVQSYYSKPELIVFNTRNFWKIHLNIQKDLIHKQFYKDFVNYTSSILLNKSSKWITTNLKQSDIVSNETIELNLKLSNKNNTELIFDQLNTVIKVDGKEYDSFSFNKKSNNVYKKDISIPKGKNIEFNYQTILNGSNQLFRNEQFDIHDISPERSTKFINESFLLFLADQFNGKIVKNISTLKDGKIKENTIRKVQTQFFKPQNSSYVLILLLLIISIEWLLRKKNKLL